MSEIVGIRSHALRGMAWTGASRVAQQVLRFGITVILARLLTPRDFGLVGLVAVFTGFAGILVNSGFSAALVQRRELEERHLTSAFWLNVASGIALCGLGMALAPGLAAFYGEPRLVALTMAISANFAIAGVTVVQGAILQRAMDFRRLAFADNVGLVAGAALGIASAVAGYGVWSLVVQTLATLTTRSALLWQMTGWRPTRSFDRAAARELWGFSGNLLGVQSLNYWSRNADNLLIGRFVGVAALGFYTRAYSIMLMPLTQVWAVTSRVMFPALSRIQDDPERVKRAYLRAIGLIALVMFPCAVGLFVSARPFILTIYGNRWAPTIVVLQILCIPALLQSVGTTTGWIFQARGRTDWMLRWNVVAFVATIVAFVIGLHWGLVGVAWAYAIRTILLTYWNFSIPGKLIDMSFLDAFRAVRGALVSSLAMGAAVWLVGRQLSSTMAPSVLLALEVAVGFVCYLGLMHALAPPEYREGRALLGRRGSREKTSEAAAVG